MAQRAGIIGRSIRVSLALALLAPLAAAPRVADAQQAPVIIYLVRHAERAEDGTSDPPLSQAGVARAQLLARMLGDAGLTHVHTTSFRRTRSTAEPVARPHGLDLEEYAPDDLAGFAERLRRTPGRHLVVGHSNSTTQLVAELGGAPGEPISETEYNRLYVLTVTPQGTSTELMRYGGGG